jgi:ARG/rhodanese/phosphatase superfamily protein
MLARLNAIMAIALSPAPLAGAALMALGAGGGPAFAQAEQRISGPHVHRNLAIYLIHGRSGAGTVPLTLAEALAKGSVQVTETGQVNELKVENTGGEEVFIQAGDIVKGGQQDRVLTVSLLLPPRSGVVPIAAFCVEPGRWSARRGEDPTRFASAAEAMPSRQALLVMAAPPEAEPARPSREGRLDVQQNATSVTGRNQTAGERQEDRAGNRSPSRQQQVWDTVARTQAALAGSVGVSVAAPQSASSLQLSLEHAALKEARAPYLAALEAAGLQDGDVVGYVAAVNGRPVSADVYPSNGLFRKVWPRQLAAVVIEAVGARTSEDTPAAPAVGDVEAFLTAAERGKVQERETAAAMRQETREGERALYNEARGPAGRWVHKNYLAK